MVPAHPRTRAEPQRRSLRAQRTVARGPLQPLPHRYEPRLDVALAARDAGARREIPGLESSGLRRLPRDVLSVVLLLPAGCEADQRQPAEGSGEVAGALRTEKRRYLLETRLAVLRR